MIILITILNYEIFFEKKKSLTKNNKSQMLKKGLIHRGLNPDLPRGKWIY